MQQHTLGRIDAEPLEQLRVPQRQLDHLPQGIDRIAHAAEIVVGDVGAAFAHFFRELGEQLDLGIGSIDDALGGGDDRHPHFLHASRAFSSAAMSVCRP